MSNRDLERRAPDADSAPGVLLAARQTVGFELAAGSRLRVGGRLDITPTGLLAYGAMVAMILLGSAEVVRAARSHRR